MSNVSRRKLITSGLVGAAGVSGIAAVARIADQHGLVPPDSGGIYGGGHTLTYAAQRLLTRNSNAREFKQSQISKIPHPTGDPPKSEEFPKQLGYKSLKFLHKVTLTDTLQGVPVVGAYSWYAGI